MSELMNPLWVASWLGRCIRLTLVQANQLSNTTPFLLNFSKWLNFGLLPCHRKDAHHIFSWPKYVQSAGFDSQTSSHRPMRGSGCCGHGGRDNARFSMGRVRGGHGRLGAGTGHSRDVLGTSLKSLNKEQTYDQEVIGQGSQQPGFGRPMKPAGRRLGTGRPMQPAAQWKLCCTMQRQEGSRYNNALISSKIHDIICSDNI